jgi:hypothetical protein
VQYLPVVLVLVLVGYIVVVGPSYAFLLFVLQSFLHIVVGPSYAFLLFVLQSFLHIVVGPSYALLLFVLQSRGDEHRPLNRV